MKKTPLLILATLSGCAGETPPPRQPESTPVTAAATNAVQARPGKPKTCPNGVRRAADGLVDDFEGEQGKPAALAGREPGWRVDVAEHASVSAPGREFSPVPGGPEGSKHAVHFAGKTSNDDPWGADLALSLTKSGFYDASKYAGVGFKIRSEKPNFNPRFKISDVSSDPEGGQCSVHCWNSFGKELVVGPEWQNVELMWSDLTQQPDWGDVRPPAITPGKIKALMWSIYSGQDFDLVVDDIYLLECK